MPGPYRIENYAARVRSVRQQDDDRRLSRGGEAISVFVTDRLLDMAARKTV